MALQPVAMANALVPMFEPNETTQSVFQSYNPSLAIPDGADTNIQLNPLYQYIDPIRSCYVLVDLTVFLRSNNYPAAGTEKYITAVTGRGNFDNQNNLFENFSTVWSLDPNGTPRTFLRITGILRVSAQPQPYPLNYIGLRISRLGDVANDVRLSKILCKSKLLDRDPVDGDPEPAGLNIW